MRFEFEKENTYTKQVKIIKKNYKKKLKQKGRYRMRGKI